MDKELTGYIKGEKSCCFSLPDYRMARKTAANQTAYK